MSASQHLLDSALTLHADKRAVSKFAPSRVQDLSDQLDIGTATRSLEGRLDMRTRTACFEAESAGVLASTTLSPPILVFGAAVNLVDEPIAISSPVTAFRPLISRRTRR
jgi:hypothetical protein